ncbi:MAG: zinc ABC transporter substrate-binding protein [Rickettsiaceae bacterium]|nr:zinc ABC transporter substrate-binding protein [Rickettsiaceae bacterium]
MITRLILIILFLSQSALATEPVKIITTITPLASIISMILGNDADISAINNMSGCPHHYSFKFSDREKINSADYFIYIDRYFDNPIANAPREIIKHKIEISKFKSINFRVHNNEINWHFWLDLNNVIALCKELSSIFSDNMPHLKSKIIKNTNDTIQKLQDLQQYKTDNLKSIAPLLITTDSLEHFFNGLDLDVTSIYQNSMQSLSQYHQLENLLKNTSKKYVIVTDIKQNSHLYKKYKLDIIQLDSENWHFDKDKDQYKNLFIKNYLLMINQLKKFKQQ